MSTLTTGLLAPAVASVLGLEGKPEAFVLSIFKKDLIFEISVKHLERFGLAWKTTIHMSKFNIV